LEASLELNKALKGFLEVSESLGKLERPKVCTLEPGAKIKACSGFMKIYELCVRVDETLRDMIRHKDSDEVKHSFERARELIENLTEAVSSLSDRERRMLLTYMHQEFFQYGKHIKKLLSGRPASRIWGEKDFVRISKDFSMAVEALRKSAAFVLLIIAAPEKSREEIGRLIC